MFNHRTYFFRYSSISCLQALQYLDEVSVSKDQKLDVFCSHNCTRVWFTLPDNTPRLRPMWEGAPRSNKTHTRVKGITGLARRNHFKLNFILCFLTNASCIIEWKGLTQPIATAVVFGHGRGQSSCRCLYCCPLERRCFKDEGVLRSYRFPFDTHKPLVTCFI